MAVHQFVPSEIEAALGRRYLVGSEIGVGGQGVVFRATRTSLPDGTATHDDVALKLHLYRSHDIRVRREIGAMQSVSHPNLARLIEHGYCDVAGRNTPYLAWEFIEGRPLSAHLKNGLLLESEVLAIGRDVAAAVAEVWSQRVVHGDIKPSNIMLRSSDDYMMVGSVDSAVLIDLGAARYLDLDKIRTLRPSSYLDADNNANAFRPFGTWGYFSPEQIRGAGDLSCASDVFSLGVVMLQCLMGRHPTDYDQVALADGIRASGNRLPTSPALLFTLDRMLSESPASRPKPADLCRRFQGLRQSMQEEFAKGGR
jgi:eukaryotic-like serine/threonine-protein kinase